LNILALDTSEARGSVAVLREQSIVSEPHEGKIDYSDWLLPTVEKALSTADLRMGDVDLFAVCTGPGSFTGLRVGLTTVKAWAEVYGKPIVGVSRLEAIARSAQNVQEAGLVAACYDAQRGQIFGALYRCVGGKWSRVGDEVVAAPEEFLSFVEARAKKQSVIWVSLDPQLVTILPEWMKRVACGDTMKECSWELASMIGRVAGESAKAGRFTDALELDANYVRRSDAEIFWKGR
jgi:tRNA threonylcarbamoyladenosine biosynthesis protein TsaB